MTLRSLVLDRLVRFRERPEWLVFLSVYATYLARYVARVPYDYYPGGDGYYIYIVARSMAWDFDIDLTNDYATCGDPWSAGKDFGTGHPSNPWYIGPAVIWAPVLFVLRYLVQLPHGAAATWVAGCRGPIPYWLGLVLAPLFVIITLVAGHRLAMRYVDRGISLTAVVVVAFGSLLATFGPLWWNYSHVWAAATLTLAVLTYVRVTELPTSTPRWAAVGAMVGLAALMRPHHALWMAAPGLLTVGSMVQRARRLEVPLREAARGLVALAAFFAVFSIRLGSFQYMYGSPWPPMFRTVYLQPWHAHPFLLLFSARAGLVPYAPLSWLVLVGFVLFVRDRKSVAVVWPTTAALLLDFWICASPLDWAGGATVGPRLLTSFTGLFVLFSALALDRIRTCVTRDSVRLLRFATVGWLLPFLLLSWQMIEGNGPYDAPSMYSAAVRRLLTDVEKAIGNPSTFPVPLVFAARYRTHPREFDRVARDGLFMHDFERGTLLGRERFVFAHPDAEIVFREGLEEADYGRLLRAGQRGRFLAPLAWPYVTAVEVDLASPTGRAGCRLRVENRLFFEGNHTVVALARDATRIRVDVPSGMFDSGINETTLLSNCSLELMVFRWIDESSAANQTLLPRHGHDPHDR